MTGDTHYDLEILAELAEGLLDAASAQPVREHLAVCVPCGEHLADLAAVREVLAATPTPAMPMGVALRIDQAIAAEAARSGSRTAVALAEAPDWDRLMADAPWETSPQEEPAEPEPVRLGVVADDGSVVRARRSRSSRRRRLVMPLTAAAAAAVVIGSAAVATTMIAASGGSSGPSVPAVASKESKTYASALAYKVTDTNYNFTNRALSGSLSDYLAPAPIFQGPESSKTELTKCIGKVAGKVKTNPFHVDQAMYNGQEATIMLFWKDKAANSVQVRVVDPECRSLRKPALAKW
ncbi:hypothetical protein [Streptosporangium sp. KLBMP 9127]|nr:hypothetical protein [Streptosporangium sp. KLBMP 9127]